MTGTWHVVTNLRGPKGDQGDQGPPGADGAPGAPGQDGASGGGSAALPLDLAPSTPNARDDDFSSGSLDSKWTPGFNPLSTVFDGNTMTLISGAPNRHGFFIRQPASAGSFEVRGKVCSSLAQMTSSDMRPGIFVANSTTGRALTCGLAIAGANRMAVAIEADNYTESADFGAGFNNFWSNDRGPVYTGDWVWFRIVWDAAASTVTCYFSPNGIRWVMHYQRGGAGSGWTQPDRVGLMNYYNQNNGAVTDEFTIDWFRVIEP